MGNPCLSESPLMNMISTKKAPISSREDIINREEQGHNALNKFVACRLEKESASLYTGYNGKDETEGVQYMQEEGKV